MNIMLSDLLNELPSIDEKSSIDNVMLIIRKYMTILSKNNIVIEKNFEGLNFSKEVNIYYEENIKTSTYDKEITSTNEFSSVVEKIFDKNNKEYEFLLFFEHSFKTLDIKHQVIVYYACLFKEYQDSQNFMSHEDIMDLVFVSSRTHYFKMKNAALISFAHILQAKGINNVLVYT